MALVDILVHMDSTPHCPARLDLAIGLARQHRARLSGLYVIAHDYYHPLDEQITSAVADTQALFEQRTEQAGIPAQWLCVDWSAVEFGMTEIINHHAHYVDLVIVGQTEPGARGGEMPADLPERVVRGAGRPVLVVPYAGVFPTVGERVLVAWKAGRESTRSVNDALPFLKRAKNVTMLAVNSSDSYADDDESLCANICDHLARHGVKTVAERIPATDIPIGDTLLNRACDEGFDLLVMGAFAHTPQGTLALGSVAGHLLRHMTVPVLMSH
jgi:nucleotide-binding universal stress UspA family protein